jgi:hypothetical protein
LAVKAGLVLTSVHAGLSTFPKVMNSIAWGVIAGPSAVSRNSLTSSAFREIRDDQEYPGEDQQPSDPVLVPGVNVQSCGYKATEGPDQSQYGFIHDPTPPCSSSLDPNAKPDEKIMPNVREIK